MKKILCIAWLLVLCGFFASAQQTIVVLGSSTAQGTGAIPIDSSWVNRLQAEYRKNTGDGVDTNIVNLAVGGTNTYKAMPTGFVPPPGRDLPDPTMNITLGLSFNPDIMIINFPSNDVAVGHTKAEIMFNFRTMFNHAVANGVRCFIATTQPRDFNNSTMEQYQRDLVDSIQNAFGIYAIDFWTDLVSTVPPNKIKPELMYPAINPDGIHVNNIGHRYLFFRVLQAPLFTANSPLPLKLNSFLAYHQENSVVLKWSTSEEEAHTSFDLEKSNNGRDFSIFASIDAKGNSGVNEYLWTGPPSIEEKSFYRLRINETSKTSYSKIVMVENKRTSYKIRSLISDGNNLYFRINRNGPVEITIVNLSGSIVKKQKLAADASGQLAISISSIAAGEYFIRAADSQGNVATERFIKRN